ncbi:hypothetical protein F53441_2119 [Fusarium austroafricanum]|uniref:Uncharacterized protein n=1 Tax=Fusarium austroafricanum TaxID=2364996 RepID=A0A8H4P1G6_9HYPO|nr:hypothetical protein F53441_2119 [Fusarium austroafricanum]
MASTRLDDTSMADTSPTTATDHATPPHDRDYGTENAELRSKISLLQKEIQEIQSLLDGHKNCSKCPQNSSTLDSKAPKTTAINVPA